MKLENGVTGEAVVVSAEGRIDATCADLFESYCQQELVKRRKKNLVLDLSTVEYLSSGGLRAIVSLGRQAQAAGGKLVMCGIQGKVREIFELAGFLSLFPVAPNLEQAVGMAMGKTSGKPA